MAFHSSPLVSSDQLPSGLCSALPTALYNAKQVRALDRRAIDEFGIAGIRLMKRAGRALFDELLARWPETKNLVVFCGSGNNGGDGYIVAALAAQKNIPLCLVEVAGSQLTGDARLARDFAQAQGIAPIDAEHWLKNLYFAEGSVIVDALLGTGFSGPLRQPYEQLVDQINSSNHPVIAADIPSGLSADTGAIAGTAVKAAVTLTFVGSKIGLFTGQGRAVAGDIICNDLEIPLEAYQDIEPVAKILEFESCLRHLPERRAVNHKGQHGHVLVVGGDLGFAGAPLMAAQAAARVGAGLVSIVTHAEHRSAIVSRQPELMVADAADILGYQDLLERASVVVIGMGLGKDAWGQKLLQQALAADKPMVVDADALNLLASGRFAGHLPLINAVVTPHPGEASRLLKCSIQDVERDRIAATLALRDCLGTTVLLKGSGSLIFDGHEMSLCPYGNPGMGSGGMGDVLSGIIGGFMAQAMSAAHATQLGVCVHSYAADLLVAQQGLRGLMATDLMDEVRRLINGLNLKGGN